MNLTTFIARKKDGRLVSRVMSHLLMEAIEGQTFIFTVEEKTPNRTTLQNRYYNFYLRLLSKELGHTRDELHEFFKNELLGTKEITVMGKTIRISPTTTTLSKSEFSDYIAGIESFTGIPAPPTNEFGL